MTGTDQFQPLHRDGYGDHLASAMERAAQGYALNAAEASALAREVMRLRARDVVQTDAVLAFVAWLEHEDAGPAFNGHGRDTPEGQRIWQAWWDRSLLLCDMALAKGRAAVEAPHA